MFIGSFLLLTPPLFSQSPIVEWQKLLGGNNGEYPNSIEHTSDGGFIVAGITEGPDNGDITGYHGNPNIDDLWVIKFDNAGNMMLWRTFSGSRRVHQTTSGRRLCTCRIIFICKLPNGWPAWWT
ncbi:MAG: hypothetical protein E6H08_15240 [Bacteroidetes bacterium]|nr:MAG: hypothetical protein E6H08_15240 [Bacteroidota bacterium]